MLSCAALRQAQMMRTMAARAVPRVPLRRPMSTMDKFYKTALKSNISHVTFVVAGAIVFEVIYGYGTEALWEKTNQGVRPFFVAVVTPRFSETRASRRLVQVQGTYRYAEPSSLCAQAEEEDEEEEGEEEEEEEEDDDDE